MAKIDNLENQVNMLERKLAILEIEMRYRELGDMEKILEKFKLENEK